MNLHEYRAFLAGKVRIAEPCGKEPVTLSSQLYDFQQAITRWVLRQARAAVFADCGLGKTVIQLEWAREVGGRVLIVCPLSVAEQTIEMGRALLGLEVKYAPKAETLAGAGIYITNYERLERFVGAALDGIVLDESSILKSLDGKTRDLCVREFTAISYRLCCTATPCPNDIAELANHAEFLGILSRREMLATFFVHDDEGWRLRGHARQPFYRWLASWAIALKSPADIGFDATAYELPPLQIEDSIVRADYRPEGMLFATGLGGVKDRTRIRQVTALKRAQRTVALVAQASGQVVVWCGLNSEAEACAKLIPDCVEVHGSEEAEAKAAKIRAFVRGNHRVLVTKPKIAGHGMNFQNASTIVFVGLNDSYETYYQCIRRCWRYGQKHPVNVYIVTTDQEREIVLNVRRKEDEATVMTRELIDAAREFEIAQLENGNGKVEPMETAKYEGLGWTLHQNDCVEVMHFQLRAESVDLSVFSPPFLSLYTYSAAEADLGNSRGADQFFTHFRYVIQGLKRITKPGRLCVCHVSAVPTTLVNDGIIGLYDLRGRVVQDFVAQGWTYHGEVVIDKDPQAQAIRTHSKGLLFVQLKRDASWLRPALADYLLVFRKPGENGVPVKPDLTNDQWIEWARPIWYGIRETDTLNTAVAKENDDDRHICPLQLGTIERAIRLWSNPGETVFSPFAGIGSEGYVALQLGRKFIGAELKPRYCEVACRNLELAVSQGDLFATGQE